VERLRIEFIEFVEFAGLVEFVEFIGFQWRCGGDALEMR
jgi:hypothetical protein